MEERLLTIARLISSRRHADIGSDHGYLLRYLLQRRKIEFGLAVENKPTPFENSQRALRGLPAEVRLGDGLAPIEAGEIDSLSISGMGAESIVRILHAHPDRIPGQLVLQANRQSELLRRWAFRSGYWLEQEFGVQGRWWYEILHFTHRPDEVDPAYRPTDLEKQFLLGPHFANESSPTTLQRFREEYLRLSELPKLNVVSQQRRDALREVLDCSKGQ